MKTRSAGTSSWLLIFGAAVILLIGGFARFDTSGHGNGNLSNTAISPSAAAAEPAAATEAAGGPELPANLTPGLDEIIKLAQAHVGDDVVLAYLQNSGRTYNPTADEILYLTDLGLSQKVIGALYAQKPADSAAMAASASSPPPSPPGFDLAPPAPEFPITTVSAPDPGLPAGAAREAMTSPPQADAQDWQPLQDPTTSYFYDGLAPYGSWVDLGDQGWFWQPTAVTIIPGWQPYRDHGRWRYTDSGWYWQSDYSWGWAAFHYGRWLKNPRFGWVWNPGQTWAPAWVAWRNTPEYVGWAPLPPGASINSGVLDVGFVLSPSSFTFVRYNDFTAAAVAGYAAPAGNVTAIFKASTPVNNYVVSGGKISNLGIAADKIAAATQKAVRQFALRDVSSPSYVNSRMSGGGLAVYRPDVSGKAPKSSQVNADSRLAQLAETEEPAVPSRDILDQAGNASSARNDDEKPVETPRTPAPEVRTWRTRKYSFSGSGNRANFGDIPSAGRFATQPAGLPPRPSAPDLRSPGQALPELEPPLFHAAEPGADRRPYYEGPSSGQRAYGEANGNQARSAGAESHATGSQATSKK